jgi:hypothetical protein
VRADVTSQLAQVDSFLEEAGNDLTTGELDAAKANLTKARYVLGRVKAQIGS